MRGRNPNLNPTLTPTPTLTLTLGIVFEEVVPGAAEGVRVVELVEGGNAEASGAVAPGDVLVGVTGIRVSVCLCARTHVNLTDYLVFGGQMIHDTYS